MPKGYQHLTYDLRCQIYALKRSGLSQNKIAEQFEVNQSAISKELRRNAGRRGYRYKQAHEKAMQRCHNASSAASKMTSDFIPFVELLIRENKTSPEQISGRLRKLHGISISHESIYRHIWCGKKEGGKLYKNLRQRGKKRNKRGSKNAGRGLIPNRVGIEFRPVEVATKQRVG